MKEELKDRLNRIAEKITSPDFLSNSGLGEIGFYIFDYPPEDELAVREHVEVILKKLSKDYPDLRVAHINLFSLLVDYLKNRDLYSRALEVQRTQGDMGLRRALKGPLHEEKIAKAFVEAADPANHDVVIMTGVGNIWPLFRSHTLLNNLHHLMESTPLVVFYPGFYDGQGLSLFGRLKDNSYYRAFRLIP